MASNIFNTLFLLARPGAGKSEIIDYLEKLPLEERMQRYHIGKIKTIDDFPMLWTWFEEDDILQELGQERLHSDENGYFKYQYLWDVLIRRICLEYTKLKRDENLQDTTVLVEFSRGKKHGGYASAFANLSEEIVENASILYVDVSWEESLRKNKKRFNPDKPDSILEHGLEDEKLKRLYYEIDWQEVTKTSKEYIQIAGSKVPYAVFDNEEDLTSNINERFEEQLNKVLDKLWERRQASLG